MSSGLLLNGWRYIWVHVYSSPPPPCTCTQNGASPLYAASQEGHTEVVDTLLENGADPNLATTVCTLLWCVHCPIPGSADSS